jgi:hypothetical protein
MVIYFLFSWGIWCGLSDECLDVWQPFRHFVTTKWLGSCVYGTSNIRYDDWACLIIFWLLFYFFSLSSFSLSILLKSIRFSFISIFLLHTLVLYIFFSLPLSVSSFSFFSIRFASQPAAHRSAGLTLRFICVLTLFPNGVL